MKRIFLAVLALSIFLAATTISSPATLLAAHKGQGQNTNSSLSLVLLNSTDGLAHWGQNMTFNVSTTATSYPSVGLNCYQNGTLVLAWTAGFFPSYPWTKDLTLSSPSWTSGGASCIATLYYSSGKKQIITLASLSFQVYP